MTERSAAVSLFAEDLAHEAFIRALLKRLARELAMEVTIQIGIAQGGHPRVMSELDIFQRAKAGRPIDILVVVIDGNCTGWNQARTSIAERVAPTIAATRIVGCPDPHVERWFLADPESLMKNFGLELRHEKIKCERDYYKNRLVNTFRKAGHLVTLGGVEFADEILDCMDFFKAGKNEPSLKHFVEELRAALLSRSGRDEASEYFRES